ncbi:hypothetical protein DSQ43_02055 [Ureaplasma urealyticum]|nr:hypothetical protein DSQ43_02055 [Ureaplasma urealyticum]
MENKLKKNQVQTQETEKNKENALNEEIDKRIQKQFENYLKTNEQLDNANKLVEAKLKEIKDLENTFKQREQELLNKIATLEQNQQFVNIHQEKPVVEDANSHFLKFFN